MNAENYLLYLAIGIVAYAIGANLGRNFPLRWKMRPLGLRARLLLSVLNWGVMTGLFFTLSAPVTRANVVVAVLADSQAAAALWYLTSRYLREDEDV